MEDKYEQQYKKKKYKYRRTVFYLLCKTTIIKAEIALFFSNSSS